VRASTHAQDGVIHVESSTPGTYTLGQFFAIWGQPLSTSSVGPIRGEVHVFVNGLLRPGDPSSLVLTARQVIQLDVGVAVAQRTVDWSHF
jgi:hypothetical protein